MIKFKLIILLSLSISSFSYGQSIFSYVFAKEYFKEQAEYECKKYLTQSVLNVEGKSIEFNVDALVGSNSFELVSLWYKCSAQNKEGLILGFYGNFWNDNGILFTGYGFKHLPVEKAIEFITVVDNIVQKNKKNTTMYGGTGNTCLTIKYDDITVLASNSSIEQYSLRLIWGSFDANWGSQAFEKTKKRFLKKTE